MPPITQPIIDLYDSFTHGQVSRRAFMDKLAALTGGTAAASALLPLLQNDYAIAQIVPENDPRLAIETWRYSIGDSVMEGLLARLKSGMTSGARHPGLVVIHENRGLNPHMRDVTRRFALEGFLAYGIDALTPEGGTPADEDKARQMIGGLANDVAAKRIAAGVTALSQNPECNGKVGIIGYCWGGGMVGDVAVLNPQGLGAGVAYYGRQPPAEKVADIKVPLMLHYAGMDERINAGIPAFRNALTAANKKAEILMYDGAQHAFNNDTAGPRYNKPAADLALARSLDFLKTALA
jgi:carboxymethylenebutenolidase